MDRNRKVRVLVVDDSAVVRETLCQLINRSAHMEVQATAKDPFEAAERIRESLPDVITLDVEMPKMDGITFLRKLMSQKPVPVVICSSLVGEGTQTLLAAMEAGAVDIVQKPVVGTKKFLEESTIIRTRSSGRPKRRSLAEMLPTTDGPAQRSVSCSVLQPAVRPCTRLRRRSSPWAPRQAEPRR